MSCCAPTETVPAHASPAAPQDGAGHHARARAAATTFLRLADGLRIAA